MASASSISCCNRPSNAAVAGRHLETHLWRTALHSQGVESIEASEARHPHKAAAGRKTHCCCHSHASACRAAGGAWWRVVQVAACRGGWRVVVHSGAGSLSAGTPVTTQARQCTVRMRRLNGVSCCTAGQLYVRGVSLSDLVLLENHFCISRCAVIFASKVPLLVVRRHTPLWHRPSMLSNKVVWSELGSAWPGDAFRAFQAHYAPEFAHYVCSNGCCLLVVIDCPRDLLHTPVLRIGWSALGMQLK
jgi:hypothetical protein